MKNFIGTHWKTSKQFIQESFCDPNNNIDGDDDNDSDKQYNG